MPNKIKGRIALALRVFRTGDFPRNTRKEIPAITPDEVSEARQFFPLDKFFIFGHARSGTTVLARLIRLHPDVHCNYQAHFFTRPPLLQSLVASQEVADWLNRSSNRWNRGGDLSAVVLRATADYILEREARREGKRIVGDKSPSNLLDGEAVRLMYNVYPDACLIYILRDGRDTVISHRFQSFIDFPQQLSKEDLNILTDFSQDPTPFMTGKRSIFTEKSLRRSAEGWVRNIVETNQLGIKLFGDHYISVRYEDLLKETWEEMSRLWAFLGANISIQGLKEKLQAELRQNPDAEWQQQKAKDIAQALQKGRQGTWREIFTPKDHLVFKQIAGETLKSWGYNE